MAAVLTIKIRSNLEIGSVIRGSPVRPSQYFKDRKKDANRKACRGNKNWE
jgi:hypothetical protein